MSKLIHWLSDYNYDFALASVPIQVILLLVYCLRRNLPVRQSSSFLNMMIANLTMTISDIVSCEMNEVWTDFPLWVMYAINMLYFVSFIIRGWALFDYAAESCHSYQKFGRYTRVVMVVPAVVVLIMILSTPWTGMIFSFSPTEGYFNCYLYQSIYFSTYFYIAATFVFILVSFKDMSTRLRIGLLTSNGLLLAGIILRKLFFHVLVTSYFSVLVILIIFLSSENPDLYRHRQIRFFNREAFRRIGTEYLSHETPFSCVILAAQNYEMLKHIYGTSRVYERLQVVGDRMIAAFNQSFVFYLRNGNFVILNSGAVGDDPDKVALQWKQDIEQLLADHDIVKLNFSVMLLPSEVAENDINAIENLVHYSLRNSDTINQKGEYLITKELVQKLDRESYIRLALKRALDNRSIQVYFQPIYSIDEKRAVGAEALARLFDDKLGAVAPDEFIRVAEKNGDIVRLGRQIFERVCEFIQSAHLQERGIRRVHVNLSPAQCMDTQLAPDFAEIAKRYQVPMSMIDFEITETAIDDHQAILEQIYRLKESGAELSLDDFGTGTSNLTRLMKLPIDLVKLDLTVVHAYFNGEAAILPDLIRMFHNADMKIVVEGVETEEMMRRLSELSCNYQQGYHFSRPVPPTDFLDYLNRTDTHSIS